MQRGTDVVDGMETTRRESFPRPRNQSVVGTVQVEASKRFAILQQAWQRAVSGEHYGGATFAIGIAVNISMVVTESAYFARYSTRENDGE